MAFTASPRFILSLFGYLFILKILADLFNPPPAVRFSGPPDWPTFVWISSLMHVGRFGAGWTGPSWLLLMGPRLMSWSATPQCSCSPPTHPPHPHLSNRFCADVQQLITTIGFTLLQSYKSPPSQARPEWNSHCWEWTSSLWEGGVAGERRWSPLPITTNDLLPRRPPPLRQPCTLSLPATPV